MGAVDELRFLTALYRPGSLVDVGAHEGLLTLPLSRLPGARVLAFEPLPAAFARLSVACAGIPSVELLPQALGDALGQLTLSTPVVEGSARSNGLPWSRSLRASVRASAPRRYRCRSLRSTASPCMT
ncbi:FkbM family methyltransferase [Pseudoroseomonas wenyumeiae]